MNYLKPNIIFLFLAFGKDSMPSHFRHIRMIAKDDLIGISAVNSMDAIHFFQSLSISFKPLQLLHSCKDSIPSHFRHIAITDKDENHLAFLQ